MIKLTAIVILFLFNLSLLAQTNARIRFKVSIVQDGDTCVVDNNVIRLKKQPFFFEVVMNDLVDLCVQASFDSSVYIQAKKGVASKNLRGFRYGQAMAFGVNNKEKSIGVTNQAHNGWYYESDSIQSFTESKWNLDMVEGKIQIDTLSIVIYPNVGDPKVINLPIEGVKTDLFLVFVDRICGRYANKDHYYCQTSHLVDLYRTTCKIVWE
ncbi:hypothetical protein [Chryseolinea soli]|uniref:Uncharacterized protein n=1 Tax=Chryseolinea soli TaxID=2321403 RepID=A0A385SD22_9BACT|nr:hypothetical protein [Chryseolinea soli]AYB29119.1 hypothetical protein D4L85_00315 [Chryseolinea soli]